MTKGEKNFKLIWLAELICRNDGITRKEINLAWRSSRYNEDKEDEIYSPRSFSRQISNIKRMFRIDIVCDRSDGNKYRVAGRDDMDTKDFNTWILDSFAINTLLIESQDLSNRILFEPIPSGRQYLTKIIDALRTNSVLNIIYQSFHMDSPVAHLVEPYCLKVYKQRWYVLGRRIDTDKMRIFSLDRVKDIRPTGETFNFPKDFDAENYFHDCIGIIVEENLATQKVVFTASGGQQDYIRSLPLHPTQEEIKKDAEESTFELYVKPSYDLIQELLRYGEDVKVLAPKWFKDKFHKIAENMYNNYNHI